VKLACSSSAYDVPLREGRIELRDWLRICAEDLDVDAVALAAVHLAETDANALRELKLMCINLQLTIASISVDAPLASAEERVSATERVRQWCDVAAFLGAPLVVLSVGALPERRTLDPGRIVGFVRRVFGDTPPNVRRAWSDVMWALRACADHASSRGVAVAVQNERGGLIDAPHQLWQAVRDVGSPWLRACPAPASMRDRSSLDLPLQYALLLNAVLREVRDDGSDAITPWPEVLRLLRAARYRGHVVLDYDGREPAETAMPRAARHWRGLLQLLARQEMLRSPNGDAQHDIPAPFRRVQETPVEASAAAEDERITEEPDLREILKSR
jgi:sugar phosphate isomerase/epimerase